MGTMSPISVVRFVTVFLAAASLNPAPPPVVTLQASGTRERLQAVSAVSDRVAWVSGTGGTFAVTTSGGEHWRAAVVPHADSLEFRDVAALDSLTAWLLASGPGPRSRIYHTVDGGVTWTLQFTNTDSAAFYDCFAFWDGAHGIAVSDGVRGRFPILLTEDGGAHWTRRPFDTSPAADSGEGAFAASGTCLLTAPNGRAWIGTGASPSGGGRVLSTENYGKNWTSRPTPIQHGSTTTGITTLAFRNPGHGFAGGGDIGLRAPQTTRVVKTDDGGRSWNAAASPTFPGAVYGLAVVPDLPGALVAVGPGGAAYSLTDAATWVPLDSASYWSVGLASARAGWMVGPNGRIAKISFR